MRHDTHRSRFTPLLAAAAVLVASRADAEPDEVAVRGAARDPTQTTLSSNEVRKVPGAFGDAFRVVDALPGAITLQNGTPYPILRGAPPGNSAVLIDGVPVPLLYHVAIGPAVIHPGLIERVDYFAGGAPASFGRSVGGVISARTREPASETRGEAHVRAFDAGALVESPLAGGRADALVAGRYSYTAAALSLLSPGVELGYWDYQARAGVDLTDDDRASVFAFGSHDLRGAFGSFATTFSADFHRVDVRYDRKLRGGSLRLAVTLGEDRSSNEQGSTRGRLGRVRLELERPLTETVRLRGGADSSFTHIDKGVPSLPRYALPFALIYPEHDDLVTGTWADIVWRPSPRVEIVPGVRADLYEWRTRGEDPTTAVPAVDPRLALRVAIVPGLAAISTIGSYHQGPSFFVPVPGLQPSGFGRGLQSSQQRSAGVEVALPAQITATGTLFSHEYRNTTSFSSCTIPSGGFDLTSGCIKSRRDGSTLGLEVLVKRSLARRVGGWVAYTLSRSEEDFGVNTGATVATPFDHTHVLNVVGSVDLGSRWTAGARLLYYSGRPFPGGERGADFVRLDVRLEKRWPILTSGWIAIVAEGLNVAFAQEESGYQCSRATASNTGGCKPVYGAAVVVPSIGIEAASM